MKLAEEARIIAKGKLDLILVSKIIETLRCNILKRAELGYENLITQFSVTDCRVTDAIHQWLIAEGFIVSYSSIGSINSNERYVDINISW